MTISSGDILIIYPGTYFQRVQGNKIYNFFRLIGMGRLTLSFCATERLIRKSQFINQKYNIIFGSFTHQTIQGRPIFFIFTTCHRATGP